MVKSLCFHLKTKGVVLAMLTMNFENRSDDFSRRLWHAHKYFLNSAG
jgi:hypothetical protein